MKIVLDTDVVVAGLRSRSGASRQWLYAVLGRRTSLLLSVPLVLQYEEVLLRREQLEATGLNVAEVGEFLDGLCAVAEEVRIDFLWRPGLKDPEDEMVLETAINGRADMLLTFNVRDFAGAWSFALAIEQPGPAWRRYGEELS